MGSVGLTRFTERRVVGRHIAPAKHRKPLARDHLGIDVANDLPPVRILRHEQIADCVFARLWQLEADPGRFLDKKLVRNLHQDAGAVAHARIGADRAAMLEVEQNGEAVVDDLVRLASLKIGDEADAAGILVERGIVKAARGRCAGIGSVAGGQMLIGAGLLRRPDIFSARPSRLHSCPVSPAQPAASVPGSARSVVKPPRPSFLVLEKGSVAGRAPA